MCIHTRMRSFSSFVRQRRDQGIPNAERSTGPRILRNTFLVHPDIHVETFVRSGRHYEPVRTPVYPRHLKDFNSSDGSRGGDRSNRRGSGIQYREKTEIIVSNERRFDTPTLIQSTVEFLSRLINICRAIVPRYDFRFQVFAATLRSGMYSVRR